MPRDPVEIATVYAVKMHGREDLARVLGVTDAGELAVITVDGKGDVRSVLNPVDPEHAFAAAEQVLAGNPQWLTHNKTLLVLAAGLLSLLASARGEFPSVAAASDLPTSSPGDLPDAATSPAPSAPGGGAGDLFSGYGS